MSEPVNAVRRAVINVRHVRHTRYEWLGVRIGGPGASMKGQWPTLLAAVVVVFACFFVIGRLGSASPSHGEPSSALRAFSGRAAIPGGLRGDSPIAGTVPSAIAPRPVRRASTPAASANSEASTALPQPLAENASRSSAQSPTVQAAPVLQPAPIKASSPAASPQHGSSAGQPSSSGGGTHPSSGGGSFDSSE
jgi:hypothetical protein